MLRRSATAILQSSGLLNPAFDLTDAGMNVIQKIEEFIVALQALETKNRLCQCGVQLLEMVYQEQGHSFYRIISEEVH